MFPALGERVSTPYLEVPTGVVGLVVLSIFTIVFALLAYGLGHHLTRIRPRRWLLTIGLALIAGVAGALGSPLLQELALLVELQGILDYPTVVPFLGFLLAMIAAIWINPAAALLVALSYSINISLWQTHQVYDIYTPVFVAILVAVLLQLRMEGRFYSWLRKPVVATALGATLQLFLLTLSTFVVLTASRSVISATNLALLEASAQVLPIFVSAILVGLIITVLRRWSPVTTDQRKTIWLPYSDNLNGRIITTFILITALLSFLIIVVAYGLASPTMTKATANNIADHVQLASKVIEDYQAPKIDLLNWAASNVDALQANDENGEFEQGIDLLLNSFESIAVLDTNQDVTVSFSSGEELIITDNERQLAADVLASGSPLLIPVEFSSSGDMVVSFVVAVPQKQGDRAAIIGRVPQEEFRALLDGLKFELPGSYTFMRFNDGQSTLVPTAVSGLPSEEQLTQFALTEDGFASGVEAVDDVLTTAERSYTELMAGGFPGNWSIGLVVPSDEIVASGLSLMGQGIIIFAAGLIFAAVMILLIVDSASYVLHQITQQTQRAAKLGIETPVSNVGEGDEIGGLATAFRRLQMAFRQQWEEQRLLLEVSENVATTFDLHQGMPFILSAAVKGMGAAGARIVVARSGGTKILSFTQPQQAESDIDLDRHLLTIMEDRDDLICRTPEDVRSYLPAETLTEMMPQAMAMVSLKTDDQHQGLICVWRYDKRHWKASQLRFMRTLASNASTLITNAKLLATVENGRRRLSAIISSTADAVLATNESNRIMLLNDAMEQYFDIKTRDVLGKKLESVLANQELVEALSANGSNPSRIEVTATDGHVLDGQVSSLNYNGGTSAGSVVVLRDVTRFKQLDEMKSDFVANVSHDLRSPLTQMLTYSQLIPMDGPLTENQVKWLSRVERAVVDMKDLIEVLLDLNRLESGVTLVTVPFRVEEVFRAIVEDFKDEASANGITIKYETEEFLPVIDGDVDLIKQAIRNIVSNAIKYAPNSGDLILSAKSKGDFVNITVSDQGPGIAESDVARVFEKFYRAESQSNGKVSGRGLGLALVKSIAERHGGKAWCESQLAVGSRFYLSLPTNNIGQKNIRKGNLKQPVRN